MIVGTIGDCLTVAIGSCTGTGMLKIIGNAFYLFGASLVTILTAVIAIGVAYLVFRFGWRKVKGATK